MTELFADADFVLDELPEVQDFFARHPDAWFSLDILDDLLLAAQQLGDFGAPVPVLAATQRLVDHALGGLHALLDPAPGHAPAELSWGEPANRPAPRLLAQAIELARHRHDRAAQEALLHWGLALHPNDNHSCAICSAPLPGAIAL